MATQIDQQTVQLRKGLEHYLGIKTEEVILCQPTRDRNFIHYKGETDLGTKVDIQVPDEVDEFQALLTFLSLEYEQRYGR